MHIVCHVQFVVSKMENTYGTVIIMITYYVQALDQTKTFTYLLRVVMSCLKKT